MLNYLLLTIKARSLVEQHYSGEIKLIKAYFC